MAFDEIPKIDKYAVNSSDSERFFLNHFTVGRGFICRKDVPDNGCDFDVELIVDGGATNSRFPVQLKSVEKAKMQFDNGVLSYSFETSRLGYLLRRQPCLGLLVIYDVASGVMYYGFADTLYQGILERKGNDNSWKKQKYITVKIPIDNLVNEKSLQQIHSIFLNRFSQAALMLLSHGSKYNLPTIRIEDHTEVDFNNTDHVIKFLKEYGLQLITTHDIGMAYDLIKKLSNQQILNDPKLTLVAAIVNGESGHLVESVFFISRYRKSPNLTKEDLAIITFQELKNNLALGNLSAADFVKELRELEPKIEGRVNLIILRINIVFFELSSLKAFVTIPVYVTDSIDNLFSEIELLPDGITKWLLELWNGENLMLVVDSIVKEIIAEYKIKESLGIEIPISERKENVLSTLKLYRKVENIIAKMDSKAKEKEDEVLQAHVLSFFIRFFMMKEIDYIAHNPIPRGTPSDHKTFFHNRVANAYTAFTLFTKHNYLKNAYYCLCNCIEIIQISRQYYKYEDEFNLGKHIQAKEQMETFLDVQYNYPLKKLLDRNPNISFDHIGLSYVRDFNDEQINNYANLVHAIYKLPEDRKSNIVNELKAYREFYKRGNEQIEIVRENAPFLLNGGLYESPIFFRLKRKGSDIVTVSSTDMDFLLRNFDL